jgi:predicted membrane channel-forming protein YqfA (hemolysin III family)
MADRSDESHAERLDRELIELLNELRVLLPGVQVLFAFLLAVPFAGAFQEVTDFQRDVYAFSLLAALAATVCLVSPTTYHRIRWRQRDKEVMLRTANRLAIAGSFFLATSMTCAILLVGDYLFARWAAVLATVITAFGFATLWFGLPLARRATDDDV